MPILDIFMKQKPTKQKMKLLTVLKELCRHGKFISQAIPVTSLNLFRYWALQTNSYRGLHKNNGRIRACVRFNPQTIKRYCFQTKKQRPKIREAIWQINLGVLKNM